MVDDPRKPYDVKNAKMSDTAKAQLLKREPYGSLFQEYSEEKSFMGKAS